MEAQLSDSFTPAHFIALLERERRWFELLLMAISTATSCATSIRSWQTTFP